MQFSNKNIVFISLFVLIVLSGTFLYLYRFVGIPEDYLRQAFIGTAFFAIAMFTVAVYQSMKIYDSANTLAHDLTEDIMQYSHELFTELYRSSPVPYIVIDEDSEVVSMNIATARLFNTELNALEGINIFHFFDNEEEHKTALIPEYFKKGRSVNDMELRMRRPDGVERWVRLSLFSFKDTNRDKRGLLTLVDITKQKMIDKAKTEFVSLASHQLRTPISGIKWNIELLVAACKDKMNETQSKYIDKISNGVDRMEILINDFLSASKFELGALEPEYADVHVQNFLKKIEDELAIMAKEKGVRVESDLDNKLGTIRTDPNMLHTIFSNLMSNAIKYTPSGGVVKYRASNSNGRLAVSVSDTGIGIPKKDQELIFSKMFRASNARTKVTDGTGLGLYIVKESIDVLGGTISFVSEKDKGTEFTFTLPA